MTAAPGLQVGSGDLIDPALLSELRTMGYTIIRIDLQKNDLPQTTALAQQVIDAGLQPLCIVRRAEQIPVLPEGALIELGNEPNLEHEGWTVESYIEAGNACVALAKQHRRRLYLGAISNLDFDGFAFLRQLPWDEWTGDGICCSIHRYPETDGTPETPHAGFGSREEEIQTLRGIVGNRPLACTEVGYHDDPTGWTESEVAVYMAWERQFVSEQGFEICVGYNINDGLSADPIDHYGYRRLDGSWKPVVHFFINAALPKPPGLGDTTLKSSGGYYACAERGGGIHIAVDRPKAGPWETWRVHANDDGTVSLQSDNGFYATAELDGSVNARAAIIGPWEKFRAVVRDNAIVAFLTAHGTWLHAMFGGGANQRLVQVPDTEERPGEWEFFLSSFKFWEQPPTTNLNLLHGVLQRNARVIGDDSGPRIIMGAHYMEGFSAFCHGKTIGALDVRTQLEILAERYGVIRNLDVLGYWDTNRPGDRDQWVAWKGREVTPIPFVAFSGATIPATPDYWPRKREYVTLLHELHLKILDDRGDMNSWTRQQKLDHMHTNGQFYNSLPFGKEVLAGVFGINEAWQNGGSDKYLLVDMLNAFKAGAGWLPAICGLSAPGGRSDPAALAATTPQMDEWEPEMPDSFLYWSSDPATVLTVHGNRGNHAHIVEHYFCYAYDDEMRASNKVAFNTEPVGGGPGVSVGQVNDPELLCTLTAAALLGGQGWVWMNGNGVFWDGPIEDMPGFEEVARLPTFLPQDIATFPVVAHSGVRFRGVRILAAVDPTRADYSMHPDGRFAMVVHTADDDASALPCERPCSEFTVINMLSGVVERSGPMAVGETFEHDGTGRLVVGRLQPQAAAVTMTNWEAIIALYKRRGGRLARLDRLFGGRGWSA